MEAPPQKILEQLRETSQKQRTELRTLLPQNDTFDERVLQVSSLISALPSILISLVLSYSKLT